MILKGAAVFKRTVISVVAATLCCLTISAASFAQAKGSTKSAAPTTTKKDAAKSTSAKAAGKTSAKTGKPAVYEFGASYCVPCKKFAPTFEKMKETYAGKAEFQAIDIEDEKAKALVDKYKVVSVPKIVVVDGSGKVTYEHEGGLDEKTLTDEVNKVVGK